jgi:histidine kinase 2/3/4 (cytokinin receptor)
LVPSQFTKQGSIFICVRVLDTCQSDHLDPPAEAINQLSRSKLFTLGSVSGTQVVPKSPSGSDTTGRVGSDRDTIYRGGSIGLSEMQLVAPRLSMVPGPLSTREAVAAWRRWEPKGSSETTDLNPVTVVVSVEDTGATSFYLNACLFSYWFCLFILSCLYVGHVKYL